MYIKKTNKEGHKRLLTVVLKYFKIQSSFIACSSKKNRQMQYNKLSL